MIEDLLAEATGRRLRGDIRGAIAACESAIKIAPADPRGYSRLAHLAMEAFDYDKARGAFARASGLMPGDIGYLNNYGMLLIYAGDFSCAREQFRRAITIDPDCVPAFYNIAPIAPLDEAPSLVNALERFKARHRSSLERSLIGFALGKLYDDLGDYDRAFHNYSEGNRAKGARYDHERTREFFEASKRAFSGFSPAASGVVTTPIAPIFIVGMPRSGSSLVEELLARLPDVAGLGERSEWPAIMAALGERHPSRLGYPGCAPHLTNADMRELANAYINSISLQTGTAARAVDKQLTNFQFVPLLRRAFPDSPIIHCMRNAIDSCLSTYFTNFQMGHAYSFDLADIARYFRAYRDLMGEWERRAPGSMIDVRYDDLIADRENVMLDLQRRLGISDASPPDRPAQRDIRTSSAWQVRQPVYTHAVARWKNYERHLGPLIDALGDLAA